MKSINLQASKFNVSQPYKGKILLYNTFSTSMVVVETNVYEKIFVKRKYLDYPQITDGLQEMGFLIEANDDEQEMLRELRQTVIDNNSQKIANIIIAPTMECNAHCFYCFENGYRTGVMTQNTADALVEHLCKQWNGKQLGITWFGGEPLLAKDTIDYISAKLKKRNVRFVSQITTNGSLLDFEVIACAINDWNVDKIQITVDAIGDEYNQIKRYSPPMKNAFPIVMRNIENALRAGLKLRIRINFNPLEKEKAASTMEYLSQRFRGYSNIKIYFAPIDAPECVVKNIGNDFSTLEQSQ